MKRRIAIAVFGFLGALSVPLMVNAGTDNIPGSMCVGTNAALTVTTGSNVENGTSSTVTAVCPAERLMIDGALTKNFSSRVWVNDRHATADVCCRVVSRTPNGNQVQGTEVCSSGNSTADQSLDLPGINEPYTFAHFFVKCTLPAVGSGASRILTYRSIQS
jgi:hypothetical protein